MYYNKISVIIIRQVMSKNDFSMYSGIYSSNDGMNTKVWGPHLWNFLFISIAGRYPIKIDKNNQEHKMIKNYFKSLFLFFKINLKLALSFTAHTIRV